MWIVLHCRVRRETMDTVKEETVTIERPTWWEALARLSQYLERNADGVYLPADHPLCHVQLVALIASEWTSQKDYEACGAMRRTFLLTTRQFALGALSSGTSLPAPGTPTDRSGSSRN